MTSEIITSRSGLAVFYEAVLASGVITEIRRHLPTPCSNRGIRPEESIHLHPARGCVINLGKVTRDRIGAAIRAEATTLKPIQKTTGAGVGDRWRELNPKNACCIPGILAILGEETGEQQQGSCCCPHWGTE